MRFFFLAVIALCASIALEAKGPTYSVSFAVQPPRQLPVKTAYAVSVARDARTGALWLYLPGPGEAGYRLNVGTILRDTQDGHWHRPPQAWADAITKYML